MPDHNRFCTLANESFIDLSVCFIPLVTRQVVDSSAKVLISIVSASTWEMLY